MIVADLPGSYSLSAGSDEEIITLDYIASGNADLALVMADASQLKRSLYMLADFVGMQVPAILVLNMMDVAKGQGITIDTEALSRKLGIPVVPMSAIRKKDYRTLYETIEAALAQKPVITGQAMESAKEKTDYIDGLLNGVLTADKTAKQAFSKSGKAAGFRHHPADFPAVDDLLRCCIGYRIGSTDAAERCSALRNGTDSCPWAADFPDL